jgi:hypothetical protein
LDEVVERERNVRVERRGKERRGTGLASGDEEGETVLVTVEGVL